MPDNFTAIPRHEIGRDLWDAFVESADEAWLWHLYDLQDAISTWPGKHDLSFAVVDAAHGNDIVAVVPLHLVEGRLVRFLTSNLLDSYGGPACQNGLPDRHRGKLLQFIRQHTVETAQNSTADRITFSLPPMSPAFRGDRLPRVNPLLALNCENALSQTWVVKIEPSTEALWSGLEGRARTAVRKAREEGVEVRMADGAEDLNDYYRLHCATYTRTGARPRPRAYFEAIWENFLGEGRAIVLLAVKDDEVIAAENFGVYKGAAAYWTGASDSSALSLGANPLLQWSAMEWMSKSGVEWYETGEAFPHLAEGKLKGLSDFKKSFGGVLYPFYKGRIATAGPTRKLVTGIWSATREYLA